MMYIVRDVGGCFCGSKNVFDAYCRTQMSRITILSSNCCKEKQGQEMSNRCVLFRRRILSYKLFTYKDIKI